MPNLLPDWMPWIQPAGRLIWGSLLLVAGLAFVLVLLQPPLLKRPYRDGVGYSIFFIVPVVGWLVACFAFSDNANIHHWEIDAIIVDLVFLIVWVHGLLMVASRKPRDPAHTTTWAEAYLGAFGVFGLMLLGYAIVPHEWLTYANSYLRWGDNTKFIWQSKNDMLFFPWHWPFDFNLPAVRDIVVSGIYGVLLGGNIKLWLMWQGRKLVREAPTPDTTPARRSRFGRPLHRWSAEAAESASATATAGSGA